MSTGIAGGADQKQQVLHIGDVTITPQIADGFLRSIGSVSIGGTALRNGAMRFLPWFDTYESDLFSRFRFQGIEQRGQQTVIATRAVSDPDYPFRERRDCSGDLCFRTRSWDAQPLEAQLDICMEPASAEVDGRRFTGFKYWFEYASDQTPIHRLIDRQTWEIGGNLNDLNLCLRNWLTPPRMKIGLDTEYSTVGLGKWTGLLPGNLWGRWTLLPSFDMQYGRAGVLLGWFDRVSLIRTVIESNPGEDALRCLDMHFFEQSKTVRTNPKTILWCPDQLDHADALNLWTRVYDQEQTRSCRDLGIKEEEPPAITFSQNFWKDFRFESSYEQVIEVASEFGADYVFIDPVWEHQQAYQEELRELIPEEKRKGTILEKFWQQNMCVTLDFEVAKILGGEEGLKALCQRAAKKGIKIISWMATHYSPNAAIHGDGELKHGAGGIYAAKESGRHPDTGYPASCWTANLNGPVYQKMRAQVLGVCERTGLAGYLWDSFCNLGWWQVDYSDGSMRPQFDKMGQLYADLTNQGLYVQPEAIVTFSNHSCCGLHGGNVYEGELLSYSYNTVISLHNGEEKVAQECRMLMGKEPIDILFQNIAHKRVPTLSLHSIPREQWNPAAAQAIKELFATYKKVRAMMKHRTVLKNDAGVLWESGGDEAILFSFRPQRAGFAVTDVGTGTSVSDGALQPNRVYRAPRRTPPDVKIRGTLHLIE